MSDQVRDDPVAQARQLIADSRQQFAQDVDVILRGLSLELRQAILERFHAHLSMAGSADPVLRQLVREMYDHFENPDSTIDIREWLKEARKVIG